MDKYISDDLYYKFQEIYDSEMCKDLESHEADKECDRIYSEIEKLLPEYKLDLLEKLEEINLNQISASKRALFYFMIKYINTFLVDSNIKRKTKGI